VAYAGEGHRLVLSSRRPEELNRVRERCMEQGTKRDDILVLPLDVTDFGAMPAAVESVIARFGSVDLLINNAGISQRSLFRDTDIFVYQTIFDVDVMGPIALTKSVVPVMLEQGGGQIVVISSVAGKIGVPYRTGYCAAKHALMGFFDSLRAELDGTGVKVSTVLPGFVRTSLSKNAITGDGSKFGTTDSNIQGGMDPDECARVIVTALKKGKAEISVGRGLEKHALWLKRLIPGLVMKMAPKFGKPT
jgi:short-subunit dehydrogenase